MRRADEAGALAALELKLPPPAVALLVALLMWWASSLLPPLAIALAWRAGVALLLVAIGLVLEVTALASFWRRKTTINPLRPATTSSLVASGVYRHTRNPMYLGMLLDLVAWAAFLASPLALALVPLFVLYLDRFQIVPEERALSALFGSDYAAYKNKVRRWL